MTVAHQMHKPLGLRIGGARLPVDEAKEPLAGGPEEVVAAIVHCFVQRGHVGRTLQHRSQGLTRVRAEVHDRLTGVTTRESVGPGGVQANALSTSPSIKISLALIARW